MSEQESFPADTRPPAAEVAAPVEQKASPSPAKAPRKKSRWYLWTPLVAIFPAAGMLALPAFYVSTPKAPVEVVSAPKAIVVDLHKQWLYAYENGQMVYHMPAVTGKKAKPTPIGKHAIGWKSEDYTSREYNAPMPYAMFFVVKRGIAIHGSTAIPWRWRANRFGANLGSAGCVSLTRENAEKLFAWAPPKTPVFVTLSLDPSIAPQTKPRPSNAPGDG